MFQTELDQKVRLQRLTFSKNVLTTGLCILMGLKLCIIEEKDLGESSEGLIVFSQTARPTSGRRNDGDLSRALLDTAHWYLLYNSPELEPYLKYVISYAYIV